MSTLSNVAEIYANEGWIIDHIGTESFSASRKQEMNPLVAILGFVGLFFACVPGLLILIVGHLARGTETQVVTIERAEAYLALKEREAHDKAQKAAQKAARKAEFKQNHKFWGKFVGSTSEALIFSAVVIGIFLIVLLGTLGS